MLLKFFLILFICYLPVYSILLLFSRTKIRGYALHSHVVSLLATSPRPWNQAFDISTFLYGVLSFILPVGIIRLFGFNTRSILGAFFLFTTGLTTALVGIFPMDEFPKVHEKISYLVFSSVIFTGLVFIPIFYRSGIFPPFMSYINFGVLGMTMFLAINSFLKRRTISILEWITFLGTILWNFLIAVYLLIKISFYI